MNVTLREIRDTDLPIFFEHQLDAEARRMAAFPGRERDAFFAHWAKIRQNPAALQRTILADSEIVGNIGCWEDGADRLVGYWLGRAFWGCGIASAALARFLAELPARPLHALVAEHNVASVRVLEKCGFRPVGEESHREPDGSVTVELRLELPG